MYRKKIKPWIAVFIVLIIGTVTVNAAAGAAKANSDEDENRISESPALVENKDEVVYAKLDASGDIQAMYVVNHFGLQRTGKVEDYGDYESVVNLTDMKEISQEDGLVTFQTTADNFYYQGNLASADAPWKFDISYILDGSKLDPDDAAGKSGELEIQIKTSANPAVDPTFYDYFMLQISVTLDTESCSNIEAEDGTFASAGTDSVIAFTVMPGNDADYRIKAVVRDFEMAGMEISALPYSVSFDMPDTDEMVDEFQELADGISELNDGVAKLRDGVSEMKDGSGELKDGSADIKGGLAELSENSGALTDASAKINDALKQISDSLGQELGEGIDLSGIDQLSAGLTGLSGGLREISAGLKELGAGYSGALAALEGAIQSIPDNSVSQGEIEALYAAAPAEADVISRLVAAYAAGQTVKGTYGQVQQAFAAVNSSIETISSSIDAMADGLDLMGGQISESLSDLDMLDQLQELVDGIAELSGNYTQFHRGLTEYMNGVSRLASGYGEFHDGIAAFDDGTGELNTGIQELYDGTSLLDEEVGDIPDMIQEEIDSMMDDYVVDDFDLVSFTSGKNEKVGLVQFVFMTEGIEMADEVNTLEEEVETLTFWDRLAALFQ